MNEVLSSTRLEINLTNLESNIKNIKKYIGEETLLMAVVKANAYGHGAVKIGKFFLENGADKLAVSSITEAMELRKSGIDEDILILGYVPEEKYHHALENNLTITMYDYNDIKKYNDIAKNLNFMGKIHIKIDTGMSRIGFLPNDNSINEILGIKELSNIKLEGMFTHFARADEKNKDFTKTQYKRFKYVSDKLKENGITIPIEHISNSAGIIDTPEYKLDMVRAGIILYGYYPSKEVSKNKLKLKPAMELKSVLSNIKVIKKGEGVGYNHRFTAKSDTLVGTIPIGYGDGYLRKLGKNGKVSINGSKYDIIGNICMDQLMVKLDFEKDFNKKDEVVLFGYEKVHYITVDDLSKKLNTINYEILCMMGRRIPRLYITENKIVDYIDYLLL